MHCVLWLYCCSAKVYRVQYNGEVVAAKEIDIGLSGAMQETFLTVGAAGWQRVAGILPCLGGCLLFG
jgi:hypothetical protein